MAAFRQRSIIASCTAVSVLTSGHNVVGNSVNSNTLAFRLLTQWYIFLLHCNVENHYVEVGANYSFNYN